MSWHVDGPTWRAYAAGRLDPAAEAAVETHATSCPDCRSGARELVATVEPLWTAVHAEITRPRLPLVLRGLRRLGAPEPDLVVLATSRDLLLSWSVAVGAAVVCAIVTGLARIDVPGGPRTLFLALAPLVPVLAVVAAYDATDPFREVTEVSPFSKLRLALLRTTAALVAAVPLTVAVTLAVPVLHGYFATWLLPGLALTVTALILLTWLRPWLASGLVALGWIAATAVAAGTRTIDDVTTGAGQLGFACVLGVLGAVLVRTSTVQHSRGVAR
ncbi:zf-HC2 domain-containing protein [Spongisporangium articulatum]|uniref:Zf-HC2 domain-containing protein n=1 Tax=Spongisporangium articulatum TaxID=3362603 RepID=A0ABW8ALE9_9ACTN